jgi:uncharacterized membrane protein
MNHEPIVEQAMGQLHMLLWFFPMIFFITALIADIFYYFRWPDAVKIGHWLIILGALSCIPTITTGLAAAASFDPNEYLLQKHRYLGFATGIAGWLYAGLRISAMLWRLPILPKHYVFLSILLMALASWACDFGGLLEETKIYSSKASKS